jgi:DNA-binding transcriptional regulator YhcF (GntR family)/ABC-type glycerol-3-phosphate transport system substrate-binding protein
MNLEISKYFQISAENNAPLYKQIIRGLEDFIADHEPGDRLPSEQALSDFLSINRETVRRAILEFVKDGRLARCRKGTFISEKSSIHALEEPHPLMFQGGAPPLRKKTIKLALFENLPNQKKFWNQAIENFNKSTQEVEASIDWVSTKIGDIEKYVEFLKDSRPDVFQLSSLNEEFFRRNGILADLPEKVNNRLFSGDYWTLNSRHSLPLHISTWGVFWNKSLAEKYGLRHVSERIHQGQLFDLLKEAKLAIAGDDILVSGMIWNYLTSLGFPEKKDFHSYEFFKDRLSEIKDAENMFMTTESYSREGLDAFLDGKFIFYITTAWFVSNYIDSFNFPLGGAFCIPEKGLHCYSQSSALGVCESENMKTDAIEKLMLYLMSFPAQELLVRNNLNCAALKEANRKFMEDISESGIDGLKLSCDTLSGGGLTDDLNKFFIYEIRDLYIKILNGQMTVDDAAKEADMRWRS